MNRSPRARLATGVLLACSLVVAACGGDDDDASDVSADDTAEDVSDDAPTESDSTEPESTEPESSETDPSSDDSESNDSTSTDDAESETETASAAFPVTVTHKYGETTVETEPQRVVSVGFAEHDAILALGVTPVGVRDWYGEQPYGTWPWAQDELGDAEPVLLSAAELNFEQIADLDPDVIIGISSGMTDSDYATLAAIAPTIAQPGDYADYATPWREQFAITAEVLGRTDEADEVLAGIDEMYAAARAEHPEFEGQTAAVAFTFEELPGAYASGDNRSEFLTELGFVIPPEFDELAGDAFYFSVSQEELGTLDTDVLVWIVSDEAGYQSVRDEPLRPTLRAYQEGREIVADPVLSGAFSHSSPLSIEFVLDELVPELALAVDGDPSTAVPSAALLEEGGTTDTELSADEQAASDAWARVFDSTVPFADKQPHLEDAEALAATVESYETAGSAMGGISLVPTAVAIDGDGATVTYDVYFGEEAAYTALEGEMTLVDEVWIVGRDEFCGFMASARNACPA